jgi:hypothetical protein
MMLDKELLVFTIDYATQPENVDWVYRHGLGVRLYPLFQPVQPLCLSTTGGMN